MRQYRIFPPSVQGVGKNAIPPREDSHALTLSPSSCGKPTTGAWHRIPPLRYRRRSQSRGILSKQPFEEVLRMTHARGSAPSVPASRPLPVILRAASRDSPRRISIVGRAGPSPEILQGRSFEGGFRMTCTAFGRARRRPATLSRHPVASPQRAPGTGSRRSGSADGLNPAGS